MTTTESLAVDGVISETRSRTTVVGSAAGRHRAGAGDGEHAAYRLTLGRVLRSEWIKLRSLRGTWLGLGAVLVVMVGIGVIAAAVSINRVASGGGGGPRAEGPLATVLLGANFGVLLLGVIGCLAGAREYASRMITATVAAVPRRWPVVFGKATVLGAVVLPVALVGVFGAFFLGMATLSRGGAATVALSGSGVLRSIIGMALYLTAIALLGLGLGIIMRSAAASIGTLIGGVIILPGIAGALLPASWSEILKYLPTNAAASFTSVTPPATDLSAGAGAVVLIAWVVLALGAAIVAIRRRDV